MRRASSRSCRPTNQASCGETRTRCCAAEAAVESVQGARRRRVPVREVGGALDGGSMVTSRCLLSKSSCRRGGFLYEPANPPHKIVVRGERSLATNYLRTTLQSPLDKRETRENPQASRTHRQGRPPHAATALSCSTFFAESTCSNSKSPSVRALPQAKLQPPACRP